MKFTLNWLKDFLDTTASLQELTDKMTAIGLEVEEISNPADTLQDFQIAHIKSAEKHPDADKLQVCQVETAAGLQQIVCGAPNARAGINVVLAPVGTIIPTNGMKIKAAKIRNVESNGMLCSEEELGLGSDSNGIIELPGDASKVGQKFVDAEGLDDPVIEIAITPNRGDCLGVYGIARDLAAAGMGKLKEPELKEIKQSFDSNIYVKIETEKCPYFIGRQFRNIKNGASPKWLRARLEAIGLRPISTLVDITNYIAYSFARPLHVYDVNKLAGGLTVKEASGGEKISALNDKEYVLQKDMVVINDEKSVQALGGVVGCTDSGCEEDTSEVFLEIALFDDISVAKTGRSLDIITDSRYRFERKVDSDFMEKADIITSNMILDLCGGEPGSKVVAGKNPNQARTISFDNSKIAVRGGLEIADDKVKEILTNLGFVFSGENITVPSWRPDVEGEADIVEEILRIVGYDNIPAVSLSGLKDNKKGKVTNLDRNVFIAKRLLAARGFNEVVTWSFMSSLKAKNYLEDSKPVMLANPISSELDQMRPSIVGNLIDAAKRNSDRGNGSVAFFETGPCFYDNIAGGQKSLIAAIRSGDFASKNLYKTERAIDVFDIKADMFAVLEELNIPTANLQINKQAPSYYHPGKSGSVLLGKNLFGYFGEIHPSILAMHDVKEVVVAFEIVLDNIKEPKRKGNTRKKLEISDYQKSVRDFAFIVAEDVLAGDIIKAMQAVDRELITDVNLFDIYQGKGIEEGKKSVAVSINIEPKDKTLTESDLEEISKKVIENVGKKCGGVLRGA